MSLQQAKVLLEKINALYKSMSLDEGKIVSIERDLMLNYVRQFYEQFLEPDHQTAAAPARPTEAAPRREIPEPSTAAPQRPTRTEVSYEPAPRPAPEPSYTPPAPEATRPATTAPERIPSFSFEPSRTTASPQPTPDRTTSAPATSNGRYASLFDHQAARELSDRLGEQRIDDLTKGMTINDRLLYANLLYHGDSKAMLTSLDQLNRLGSMSEARVMLEDMARQYDWIQEEREETARSFIKMVRRRYN